MLKFINTYPEHLTIISPFFDKDTWSGYENTRNEKVDSSKGIA